MKSGLRVLQSAYYVYDGDGNLVKSVINGKVIYFIGRLYQKQVDGQTVTEEKTYFNGAQAVAMRTNDTHRVKIYRSVEMFVTKFG